MDDGYGINTAASGVRRPSARRAAKTAWQRMRAVLFRPFDLGRWFSIGFCAWLASIGEGCGGGNLPVDQLKSLMEKTGGDNSALLDGIGFGRPTVSAAGFTMPDPEQIRGGVAKAWSMFADTPILLVLLTVAVIFGIAFGLLFAYLRARGSCMFVHRWYRPEETVTMAWRQTGAAAMQLFCFRLVMGLIGLVALIVLLAWGWSIFVAGSTGGGFDWIAMLPKLAFYAIATLTIAALFATVEQMTTAFVVPILLRDDPRIGAAWLHLVHLLNAEPLAFFRYYLLSSLLWFVAALALLGFIIGTLFLGLLAMLIPWVGTVVILPVLYFFLGYNISFLEECGGLKSS